MHKIPVAQIITKKCPMSEVSSFLAVCGHIQKFYADSDEKWLSWGYHQKDIPARDIPAMLEKACGRYTRGKNKGLLRGWAHIYVVNRGGWQRFGPGERNGTVRLPGQVIGVAIMDYTGKSYFHIGDIIS